MILEYLMWSRRHLQVCVRHQDVPSFCGGSIIDRKEGDLCLVAVCLFSCLQPTSSTFKVTVGS